MSDENDDPFGDASVAAERPLPPLPPVNVYFTASTFKLIVMSVFTLGIYELYWFYKNWILIRQRTGKSLSPFWRATFAPFWAYALFKDIKTTADENRIENGILPIAHGLAFLVLFCMGIFPKFYALILFFLSVMALIPANRAAVAVNWQLTKGFKENNQFSGWNWVAMSFGALFLILEILSLMFLKAMEEAGTIPFDTNMNGMSIIW